MRRVFWTAFILALLALSISAADPQLRERGKQQEQRACTPCHSLRLVESQRLSAGAWGKELDKMERWGAVIADRQLLLDYLSQEYPDSKPVPLPERSADAAKTPPQAPQKRKERGYAPPISKGTPPPFGWRA